MEAERDLLRLNRRRAAGARRAVQRPRQPVQWTRLVLRSILAAIVGLALYQGIAYALRPHCLAWVEGRKTPELLQRDRAAKEMASSLSWQQRYARSKPGAASLSREYGYLKKGEVLVSLPGLQAPAKAPAQQAKPKPLSLWDRVMLLLCRFCRVDVPG